MKKNYPNYVTRYYLNQARLRGVTTVKHVEELEARLSLVYDKLLASHLAEHKPDKIIELACGPGIFLRYLRNRGFSNALGVEMADCYLDICAAQGINVIKADALEWLASQAPASIDVIVAIDFIEHLDKDSFVDFLDNIQKVLKPKGLFIFRCPCGDSPFNGLNFYNDITHQSIFTTTAHNALVKMCGMQIIEIRDEYPSNIKVSRKVVRYFARYIMRKMISLSIGQEINILGPTMWIIGKPV